MKRPILSRDLLRKLNLFVVLPLCVSSTLLALNQLRYPLIGIDDANIYFIYARNLAQGHGFVYNVGGERVEGFTSLLWTIISTLAFKFFAHPELTLLVINILLVSVGIVYALNHLQGILFEKGKSRGTIIFWSALYLIFIFTSPRYIVWNTITLMENALWSTLLLLTTLFVLQDHESSRAINVGLIPLLTLLLITRPESFLWVPLFILILFLRLAFQDDYRMSLQYLAPSMISTVVTLTLLTLFRLYYFGYPLPNTFYAKVSPSFTYDLEQGTIYLIRYFKSDPVAAVSMILISLSCVYSLFHFTPQQKGFFLPFIVAAGFLVPLLTGGDHFGSFRFYQNIFPITILCCIYILQQIYSRIAGKMKLFDLHPQFNRVLFSGLVLLSLYGFAASQVHAWSQFVPEIEAEFNVAEYERRNGAFIQDLFSSLPKLPSIGVIASGGIKYSYSGEIIDLLGLNNTKMAHNHGDRKGYKNHAAFEVRTFFELQPDIVWPIYVDNKWQYSETELRKRWENTLGFKGLFNDPHFLEVYEYAKVSKQSDSKKGTALVAWFKKDFIKALMRKNEFQVEEFEYTP